MDKTEHNSVVDSITGLGGDLITTIFRDCLNEREYTHEEGKETYALRGRHIIVNGRVYFSLPGSYFFHFFEEGKEGNDSLFISDRRFIRGLEEEYFKQKPEKRKDLNIKSGAIVRLLPGEYTFIPKIEERSNNFFNFKS
ncbi:hypothetical protein COU58_02070 [Candidatus Pacearchaeota archaeon CG10_big_fil_rev_8_21_14_0_10_32_42]|nr:MAG: hypothetical protein COU58_02070 [Candidatus Pacearchaeota archaeon CG10_big_fil_rev_8_21_14_0_10_32_42]